MVKPSSKGRVNTVNTHLGRRLSGRERDGGMILRVPLGIYVQGRASPAAPVAALLLPSFSLSFFGEASALFQQIFFEPLNFFARFLF